MINNLVKFFLWTIALLVLQSCSSHNTKAVVNDEIIDNLSSQITSSFIDSINTSLLTKNRWLLFISSDAITYLTFKQNGKYKKYDCELDDFFEGTYHTSKDSIFLFEYGLVSELPNEVQIVNTAIYTYIYQADNLKFVSNKIIEDGKVVYTYLPDRPIYYKREK